MATVLGLGRRRRRALLVATAAALLSSVVAQTALVPAILTFGDSSMDVGNNNFISAAFKADFFPYGMNFTSHKATGRFSDGKLVIDFTAEAMGFAGSPPAYLGREAARKRLLQGVSFASAGSGYYEGTAETYHALTLAKQLEYFRQYRVELGKVAGKREAARILSGAVYLMSFGNGDFLQNFYINPSLQRTYTLHQFSQLLLHRFACFIEDLYSQGARRIGATSLPPVGCLPAPINLYGGEGCISSLNSQAWDFNRKLNSTASSLSRKLPGLNLVILDIYKPLMELTSSPVEHGFTEARRGCCGTGTARTTVLCRPRRRGVCENPANYVFWDGVHPTQAANQYIANSLISQGIVLIG